MNSQDEIKPAPLLDWQEGYYKNDQSILAWLQDVEAARDTPAGVNISVSPPEIPEVPTSDLSNVPVR